MRCSFLGALLWVVTLSVFCCGIVCSEAQESNECSAVQERWEKVIADLKAKLHEYETLRQTPVKKLIGKSLIDESSKQTIAKQISKALRAKAEMLDAKRKECLGVLSRENQLFGQIQSCLNEGKGKRSKTVKRLVSERSKLRKAAVVTIAEVREVEGKGDYTQYVDSWRNRQDPYYGNMGNYWQNYYRGYRGF